jgi:hypothetical protein
MVPVFGSQHPRELTDASDGQLDDDIDVVRRPWLTL